ncbi:MAG TPA: AraC family transcriptional regulator [Pseudomonadales bacterium]|nr:AraC family transcriptional regulator [Pseudomonadales bacterium]
MIEYMTTLALGHEATSRVLKNHQVDPAQVFEAAGIDPEPYRDPDSRLRAPAIRKLWDQCTKLTKNPCFAFEVGMAVHPGNLHAVGYAWLASRNVREALQRLVRYHRVLSTAMDLRLEETDAELTLVVEPSRGWPQEGIDALTAAVVAMCREITYEDFRPLRIEMARPQPTCVKQLAKYFLCPMRYGAERTCIVFRRDQTEKFLPRQNPALARANDEVALRYIAQMDRSDVLSRSKLAMMEMLSNGEPSRKALAERLHMSERTLARRLRERGLSFRSLLDGVRKELGLGYMEELRHAITDVAYLLGFSDQSNFARSFRRWTGSTPSEYRASRKAPNLSTEATSGGSEA